MCLLSIGDLMQINNRRHFVFCRRTFLYLLNEFVPTLCSWLGLCHIEYFCEVHDLLVAMDCLWREVYMFDDCHLQLLGSFTIKPPHPLIPWRQSRLASYLNPYTELSLYSIYLCVQCVFAIWFECCLFVMSLFWCLYKVHKRCLYCCFLFFSLV